MAEIISELFQRFAFETGIAGAIRQYGQIGVIILIMLAAVMLVMGFKTYRVFFSLLIFMGITILSCVCLEDIVDWGAITTCFAVLGTIVALFMYRCNKVGGCVICGLILGLTGWLVGSSIILAFILAVLGVIAAWLFPVISICLATSLWGSLVLTELLLTTGNVSIAVVVCGAGFAVQMVTNQKQSLFPKKYPDKVTHWLEQRKGKKHADSI